MKTNLKNKPLLKTQGGISVNGQPQYGLIIDKQELETFLSDMAKWFEAFEKELRELTHDDRLCSNCQFSGKPCLTGDSDCAGLKKLKEVLGEE